MDATTESCVAAYRDLKNLKLVGERLKMPWQTVYVRLKKAGEPVTGDKARYGSDTDRTAARAERWFQAMFPEATNQNNKEYQSLVDFMVGDAKVDVKVSNEKHMLSGMKQWVWSVKKQEFIADFFVCIALVQREGNPKVFAVLVIPGEVARFQSTIRVSWNGSLNGKWAEYSVDAAGLREIFRNPNP